MTTVLYGSMKYVDWSTHKTCYTEYVGVLIIYGFITVPVVLVLRKSSSISSLLISVNIVNEEGKGVMQSSSSSSPSGTSIVLVSSFISISSGVSDDDLNFLPQQSRSITV